MHVHVEIADDDEAVRVIDGIRPWLPLLTAISANSPYWEGATPATPAGAARSGGAGPRPVPREPFGDIATYREVAGQTIAWGGAMDPGMLYFDARLSE